ncbi:MAG: MFS transporter [Aliidongia sp.]
MPCLEPAGRALTGTALFYYLIGIAIVTRFFITLYEIPSSALAPELTDDYHERTSFLGYRLAVPMGRRAAHGVPGLRRLPAAGCDPQGRAAQPERLCPLRLDGRGRDVRGDPGLGRRHASP